MQKKWIKKKLKAERGRQAKAKAERLAKLRDPQAKRGYRRLVIGDKVYQWRHQGTFVELRTPGDASKKLLVAIWKLQGFADEAAWLKEHEGCCRDGCCDPCNEYWASPKLVREYIETSGI